MNATDDPALQTPLVLYDGGCGLCNRSVRWIMARDGGAIRFAPLQGPTAARLRERFPAIPDDLDSVVLIDGGRAYLRSQAFLRVSRYLRRPWRWLYAFRWVPAFLLDPLYWVVAKLRYRLFGRYDACRLPAPDERARFLDL